MLCHASSPMVACYAQDKSHGNAIDKKIWVKDKLLNLLCQPNVADQNFPWTYIVFLFLVFCDPIYNDVTHCSPFFMWHIKTNKQKQQTHTTPSPPKKNPKKRNKKQPYTHTQNKQQCYRRCYRYLSFRQIFWIHLFSLPSDAILWSQWEHTFLHGNFVEVQFNSDSDYHSLWDVTEYHMFRDIIPL